MRKLVIVSAATFLASGTPGMAVAHVLEGDQSWAEQLLHQVTGTHHLVLTAILLAVGLAVLRARRNKATARKSP